MMNKYQKILTTLNFEQKSFVATNGQVLPYCERQIFPEKKGRTAVFLFLHGAGERGSDNCRQLCHGAEAVINYLQQRQIKCLVLFPQCPNGKRWVETPWSGRKHTMKPEPSKILSAAMELLDKTMQLTEIDAEKIYIAGISMGGYGCWDMISRIPDVFAAALICCGGGDTGQVGRFCRLPIQIFHGADDPVVPVIRSRNMVKALNDAGAKQVVYHELSHVNHDCWTAAFNDSHTWDVLFTKRK